MGRGNKQSGAEVEKRRADIAAAVKADEVDTIIDLAEELGVSRWTVMRDLKALRTRYVAGSKEDIQAFRQAQYDALMALEDGILSGAIPADVGNTLLRVRGEVAKLFGLNEPERKITAHIDATNTTVQYRFLEHSHGLTAEQVEEVFKFMDSLPRRRVAIADCFRIRQLGDGK